MTIRVTIGVCVRNCENQVRDIGYRISKQDFPHEETEVLFVDDGSTDDTLSSISKYAPTMGIEYKVFHHNWKGLGYSRNVVLKNSRGDYIVWIDDGTIIPEDFVRRIVDCMDSLPAVGIAKGAVGVVSGLNPVATLENLGQVPFYYKYSGKFITKLPGTGGSIYRVKAAKAVGGFDETIQGATEDTDIAYRILEAGWQIYITRIKFFNTYDAQMKKVWNKNFRFGYETAFLLRKHRELYELLYKSTPPAGFIEGTLAFPAAFEVGRKKIAAFLPLFFSIKRTAWCLGYIKRRLILSGKSPRKTSIRESNQKHMPTSL
jgi:glycosyltransferase involved in cell wall biosynthesis